MTAVALAAIPAALAARGVARAPRPALRERASLPRAAASRGQASPLNPIVSPTDTFLVAGFGFEDRLGICQTRGWVGEDRAGRIYAHPSASLVVNQSFFAGLPYTNFGAENLTGRLSTTRLSTPRAVALNDSGGVIFSDEGHDRRLFEAYPASGIVRVYGIYPNGVGTHQPVAAAFDPVHHNVVASDFGGGKLLRFPGTGGVATIIAGLGPVAQDTTVAYASVGTPAEIALGPGGEIYFADPSSHRVRKLTGDGHVVTVIGTGVQGAGGDGTGVGTQLSSPSGVALNPSTHRLYVGDTGNDRVLAFDLAAPSVPLLSTTAVPAPRSLALTGAPGDLFIASGDQVLEFEFALLALTPVAGGGGYGPPAGATLGTQQVLLSPFGLTPDGAGGLLFADPLLDLVFHLQADGQIVVAAGVPAGMTMGSQALWFGADAASDPAEVAGWVQSSGYGNNWSQRLLSPPISLAAHPHARLSFDAALDLGESPTVQPVSGGEFVLVQALKTDGGWTSLAVRLLGGGAPSFPIRSFAGRGIVHVTADLDQDGNDLLGLAAPTKLRLVVQTSEQGSNEDGRTANTRGAAVVDNLRVDDPGGPVVAPADFEAGGTGSWTLAALNGVTFEQDCIAPHAGPVEVNCEPYTRDLAPPNTAVQLTPGFDAQDPTCAWTFLSAGDSVPSGAEARLTSPWFAVSPGHPDLLIRFSGKLNTLDQSRFLRVSVRGKNAGDPRPRFVSSLATLLDSDTHGGDGASPYLDQKVLHYPADFESPQAAESVAVVFELEDRGEESSQTHTLDGRPRTRLPYLDDIRLYQLGVDADHDGVADEHDACPAVCAAGQDGDLEGCVDPTATLRHVESWAREDLPLHYAISIGADPANPTGEDASEIAAGFAAWTAVPTCTLQVVRDPDTPQTEASGLDGVNLVTFSDTELQFPPGVLAVTPTLSFTRRSVYHDRIVLPGQIVDADMIFNPASHFRTPGFIPPAVTSYDLRSVTTHEAGHFFGLSHSGVLRSTMFFVLQDGTGGASLEADDRAGIGAAYPAPAFTAALGTIEGTVTRGGNGAPLPGALVTAVSLDAGGAPLDTVSSDYTDELGRYHLRGLAPGVYGVRLTPLDGEVGGFPLTPEFVSERVAAGAQTNFAAEWRSDPETASDDPDLIAGVTVGPGTVAHGIDIISNIDVTPPQVTGVSPADQSTGVRIDPTILVAFSERIDPATLNAGFRLHVEGSTSKLGGSALPVNGGRTVIFNPTQPLALNTTYVLDLTGDITDRQGVPLAPPFSSHFHTLAISSLAIADVEPRAAAAGTFLTVLGGGFDPAGGDSVAFAGTATPVPASHVTPSSMVAAVPPGAASGSVRAIVHGGVSNPFPFTVLPAAGQVSPARVTDAPLGFAPTDVALAPDGARAYAVGPGGLALVGLATGTTSYRSIGAASHIALTPDGRRALVTQPALGVVLDVDADPASVTFGQTLATIHVGAPDAPGLPEGIAVAPSGRRAFVTDQTAGTIYGIDTDPTSATRDSVVEELADPAVLLTGGVALLPTGDQVLYTTGNEGSRSRALASAAATVFHPGTSGGGVAVTPQATEALYAGAGAFAGQLLAVQIANGLPGVTSQVALGGSLRDVIARPQKQSALAVNSATNRLQVIGMDPADAGTYHQLVAQVETGITPLALAQSLDGSVIAVANFGSRSLSIYRTGGGLALLRSLPEVGRAGDRVAVQAGTGLFAGGSQVDLGDGPFPVSYRTPGGEGAAFVVPAGPQREASLTGVDQLGGRTLALPFRVVDPIGALAPHATGLQLDLAPISCLEGGVGALDALRISPDGGLLALVRNPGACAGPLELYAADARRPKEFAQVLSRADLVPAGHVIRDAAFTSDGRRLWMVDAGVSLRIADSDRSSPSFGSLLSVIGFPAFPLSGPGAVAADPLGRFMCAGDMTDDTVRIFRPDGTPSARLPALGTTDALAASPDGRVLVRAGGGRAEFFSLESLIPIGASPVHGATGVGTQHLGVAIPTGGNRAVVRFSNGIGLYNLDPGAGAIGAELYFGNPFAPGVAPGALAPGPGGGDVLAACAACDTLLRIDAATIPPLITYAPVGQRATRLAASPDGRMLWLARSSGVFSGDVKLLSLSPASALDLVSGGGQSGLALSTLPVPVRVRVTSGIGAPETGVVVRFALGSGGTLDADSSTLYKLTDPNGEVEVAWTLGAVPGAENLTVTALGVPGGTLTASAQVVGDDSQIVPAVVEFGPPNGAVNVATGTPVYVRFNQKMQPASVGAKLKLFANGGPVAGTLSFQDGGRLVLDQPTQPLLFAARCSLTVEAGALDTDGQALAADAFATFTVQAPPPLAVTALSPTAGPVGAVVVLNGTGFSSLPGQNTLLFNGTPTTVTSASPTSLGGRVPPGAATGPVTVQVGAAVSPGVQFTVLAKSGPIVGLSGEITAGSTPTKVAITPDGGRAYVTNPSSNTVTALDLHTLQTLAVITVGVQPSGIDLLPDGSRAYVCNQGSDDVSVIDIVPGSPTYHQVIATIPVGHQPRDLAVSPLGPVVIVVNFGSSSLSVIDANPGHATFDQVTTTTNTGSGGNAIGITPDGGRAYIATSGGTVEKFDLYTGAVTTTTNTGSGGNAIGITPDGTLALVLLQNGEVVGIDIVPGSSRENQVMTTTNTGSGGGGGILISPDGGTAYVTDTDGNVVFTFLIVIAGGSPLSLLPGPAVQLVLEATIPVGLAPAGIAIDPLNQFLLVANSGAGSLTVIGHLVGPPPVAAEFEFDPSTLNLNSLGAWVSGRIEPPAPFTPADIVVASLRLNGVIAVDPAAPVVIGDGDQDGIPDLTVKFPRAQVELILPEGDAVPVTVTGTIGARALSGTDVIRVKRSKVTAPAAGAVLPPGHPYTIRWTTPLGVTVIWAAVLHSLDNGLTWTLDATQLRNTGKYAWPVPGQGADSARVAVALVESSDATGTNVTALLGVSDPFRIGGTTAVEAAPAELAFAPIRPNPADGRAVFRFGLPRPADVRLEIYDLEGRRVRTLARGEQPAGWHELQWSGRVDGGQASAGIYFVRFKAEGREFKRRLVWLH